MDELAESRIQTEADAATEGALRTSADAVKAYARDLHSLLIESDVVERKSFLRSFIKQIDVKEKQVVIHYNLPMPSSEIQTQEEVLPIITSGSA